MSKPETSYDAICAKSVDLIRNKLFHSSKENGEIVALSEEFAHLWPGWVKNGNLENDVNMWLGKLNLATLGSGVGLAPTCLRILR